MDCFVRAVLRNARALHMMSSDVPQTEQVYAVRETKSGQVEIVTIPVGSPNNVISIATLPGEGWALVTLFGGVSYWK